METYLHDLRRVLLYPTTVLHPSFHLKAALRGSFLVTVVLLSACASQVPETIRNASVSEVSVAQVREGNTQQYTGTRVRWGGRIAVVENGPSETLIEVVSQPLDQEGRPKVNGGGGRFLAKFPGFIDPLIYDKERSLTVVGTLRGEVERKIGKYAYTFPVVEVESHYLWKDINRSNGNATDWWRYDCYPYPYYRYSWPYGPYYW
ncbi:MAG: Slp family lipoprotein [Gammaproteobacteria bacterium]|jgi:outer membrane lipoprotein